MNVRNKIWFDKRSLRRNRILMIVAAVVAAVGGILVVLTDTPAFGHGDLWQKVILVSLFMLDLGVPMFLIFLHNYLEAFLYLKRLKNNGYEVPSNLNDYGATLENLPHTREPVLVNQYSSDSKIAGALALLIYVALVLLDVFYCVRWYKLEPDVIVPAVLAFIALSVFPVVAFLFFRQGNKDKYRDNVDMDDGKHKVRKTLFSSVIILVILGVVGLFGVALVDSMTRYVYRSRNNHDDQLGNHFAENATMNVTSEDLVDGEWSSELETRAPQLSFDEVEGASYYVIYMVDETHVCHVAWYVESVSDVELPAGSDVGVFNGIIDYGDPHKYSITVYALAGEPDTTIEVDPYHETNFAPGTLYDIINVSDNSNNIPLYGNVLAYGYISGEY